MGEALHMKHQIWRVRVDDIARIGKGVFMSAYILLIDIKQLVEEARKESLPEYLT